MKRKAERTREWVKQRMRFGDIRPADGQVMLSFIDEIAQLEEKVAKEIDRLQKELCVASQDEP